MLLQQLNAYYYQWLGCAILIVIAASSTDQIPFTHTTKHTNIYKKSHMHFSHINTITHFLATKKHHVFCFKPGFVLLVSPKRLRIMMTCMRPTVTMTNNCTADNTLTRMKFASAMFRSRASCTLMRFWICIDLSRFPLARSMMPYQQI